MHAKSKNNDNKETSTALVSTGNKMKLSLTLLIIAYELFYLMISIDFSKSISVIIYKRVEPKIYGIFQTVPKMKILKYQNQQTQQ